MVLGLSTAALNETFQNFHTGVKALQASTCKKQCETLVFVILFLDAYA